MYDHANSNEGTAPRGIRSSVDRPLSAESDRRRALVAAEAEEDLFCAKFCGTSRHLKICPLGIGGAEEVTVAAA